MQRLYDSHGHHIADFQNGQRCASGGGNIGHYISSQRIFVDMSGRYLDEIVHGDRLMYKRRAPHQSTNYGSRGNFGTIGNCGNPGNRGSIGSIRGYEDIPNERLKQ